MWRPDQPHKNRCVSLSYPPNVLITERDTILRTFFADRHTYVWANVMRRAVYLRQPWPVFPLERAFEYLSLLPQLLHACDSLVHLPHALIDYRQHPSSITKVISEKWCVDFVSALLQVASYFRSQAISEALKLQIDIAAGHFYVGIVKNSYQLPWGPGRAVRAQVKQIFLASLFNEASVVLGALNGGAPLSHDVQRDAVVARQVRHALEGGVLFDVAQGTSRKLKLWRRLRATA